MKKIDLHMHTLYCDGKNSPEQMVCAAIEKGFECIGFSGHSYTFFDEQYCMSKEGTLAYRREIARLKEKYADKIRVLCGIEQDYYCAEPTDEYDYVIGSVHYIQAGEKYIPVDETPEILLQAAADCFGGDIYRLCEAYFATVAKLAKTKADIIGHFDLITKFNEGGRLFDEANERYIASWQKSAEVLLESGKVFEINTGAMSRGYRKSPYPSESIRAYLKQHGAKFILSSDAHAADDIGFGFETYQPFVSEADVLRLVTRLS